MQEKEEVILEEEIKDTHTGKMGIRHATHQYTLTDEIKLRAKRPLVSKVERTATLNYSGRVKQSSKKNAQLEFKFKSDNKIRLVLQHGKFCKDTFILDYGYPLSDIQAFAFALGLQSFGRLKEATTPGSAVSKKSLLGK